MLDGVSRRREHHRRLDSLIGHQGQPQVPAPVGLLLFTEARHQLGPLLVVQALQGVQAVEQHPRHRDPARSRRGLTRDLPEHLVQLLGREGDLPARGELCGRPANS